MARLAKIITSALMLCDAGDLSSIQWKTQGDVTATGTSFVANSDDMTNSNYAYSEFSNVVSFRVKPNYDSSALKSASVGFICGSSFTDTLTDTKAFFFSTHPFPRVIFYTKGSAEVTDPVMTLTATTEIDFKIDSGNVTISVCADDTDSTCELKTYAMDNAAATSCMAKMILGTSGAGFEVKTAVALDPTTTTAAPTTTTVATTTTAAAATTNTSNNATNQTTTTPALASATTAAPGAASGVASGASGLCVESTLVAAAAVAMVTSIV